MPCRNLAKPPPIHHGQLTLLPVRDKPYLAKERVQRPDLRLEMLGRVDEIR